MAGAFFFSFGANNISFAPRQNLVENQTIFVSRQRKKTTSGFHQKWTSSWVENRPPLWTKKRPAIWAKKRPAILTKKRQATGAKGGRWYAQAQLNLKPQAPQ